MRPLRDIAQSVARAQAAPVKKPARGIALSRSGRIPAILDMARGEGRKMGKRGWVVSASPGSACKSVMYAVLGRTPFHERFQ